MNEISVAISVIGFLCSISSIVFAYLALKRNEKNDTKIDGERFGLIQADIKYIVKTLSTLEEKFIMLDNIDREMLERLAKVEQSLNMEKNKEKIAMEFSSVPIIVLCCYIIGEIYKIVFKNKKESYKLIPLILSIFGGIIGIVIFYTNPEMILDAHNVWVALGVGIVSGASSTGANQIIKQVFSKDKNVK